MAGLGSAGLRRAALGRAVLAPRGARAGAPRAAAAAAGPGAGAGGACAGERALDALGLPCWEEAGLPAAAPGGGGGGSPLGLAGVRRLLGALGHPERRLAGGVHVVGSKGKGSVAALIAGALGAAGAAGPAAAPCGLFASPHVFSLGERVCLAGGAGAARPADPGELADLVAGGAAAVGRAAARGPLTRFEALTGLALRHFARRGCRRAVLEAGVGGAEDATNVLGPRAAVVACGLVDFEHTALLGESLAEIVRAKLGAGPPGVPIVLGRQRHPEVYGLAREVAAARGSELVLAEEAVALEAPGGAPASPARSAARGGAGGAGGGPEPGPGPEWVRLAARPGGPEAWAAGAGAEAWGGCAAVGLRGAHQAENARLAAAALLRLGRAGWPEGRDWPALARALAAWRLPGRFQVVPGGGGGGRAAVLDGAHTPLAAAALAAEVRRAFPGRPVAAVLAVARDKDAEAVAGALLGGLGGALVLAACAEVPVAGGWARALPAADLAAAAARALRRAGRPPSLVRAAPPGAAPGEPPLARALAAARAALPPAPAPGVLLVAGSLHAVRAFAAAEGGPPGPPGAP